jgi:hypothetical protein
VPHAPSSCSRALSVSASAVSGIRCLRIRAYGESSSRRSVAVSGDRELLYATPLLIKSSTSFRSTIVYWLLAVYETRKVDSEEEYEIKNPPSKTEKCQDARRVPGDARSVAVPGDRELLDATHGNDDYLTVGRK